MSNIDDDLIAELDKATEFKKPNVKDEISKVNASFFNDEDVQVPEVKTDVTPQDAKENPTQEVKTVSEKDARLSGETAAATTEFIASIISEGIIAIKTNMKFAEGERKLYNNHVRDSDKSKLTEQGLFLRQKGDRIMREKNEKLKEVEPSEKARQRLEQAFTKYYKITGKEMSPGMLLGAAITESVVKTILNAAID